MPTQNVNLTDKLDRFVKEQISTGQFNNPSEVHQAALSQMATREEKRSLRRAKLREEIAVGDADIMAGRVHGYASANALYNDIVG